MIKFYIIDFICSFSLESFIDKIVFSICYPQLLAVENRSESGVRHETTIALVLILEEWLNKQSSVSYISANSLHAFLKFLFFSLSTTARCGQNRWSHICSQSLLWNLLQVLLSEYPLNVLVELKVSDFDWISGISVVIFKSVVLFSSQLKFLCIQCSSKFGCFDGSLSKRIMVLQELT